MGTTGDTFSDLRDGSWLPILEISEGEWLGLLGGDAYFGGAGGAEEAIDLSKPVGLLPLLEESYGSMTARIRDREVELQLPVGSLLFIVEPIAIFRVALAMKSDYWCSCALGWIEGMASSLDNKLILDEMTRAKWLSQGSRHRALRILKAANARA